MKTGEIIEKFKDILDKQNTSFITELLTSNQSHMGQGINFDITNSIPDNTSRTYLKVESLEQAKEIWTGTLKDLPKDKQIDKVFDKYLPTNLNLTKDLFFSIYTGKK